MVELLIKGGMIVDGSGDLPYHADVAVHSGKIVWIGQGEVCAEETLNAEGKVLAPGFVDSHSHDDIVYFWDSANVNKLSMGVTTTISGNCGESFFPVTGPYKNLIMDYFSMFNGKLYQEKFISTEKYLRLLDQTSIGLNAGIYVGHGTLRLAAMGYAGREPTEKEYAVLEGLLSEAMQSGAYGLSSGLLYAPGSFSKTDELIRLGKTVAKYNGVYVSHLRHEGAHLLSAVNEAIEIGRQAGIPVILSHLKVMGNSEKKIGEKVLEAIEKANAEGIAVSGDVYPYDSGATYLPALLPPALLEGGFVEAKCRIMALKESNSLQDLERQLFSSTPQWVSILEVTGYRGVLIISAPYTPEAEGKTLVECAEYMQISPVEALVNLFLMNDVNCMIAMFTNNLEDMVLFIKSPRVAFCSDGVTLSKDTVIHPRTTGSFTKVLRECVREKGMLTIQEAIRKMTSLPCQNIGIRNKGLIRVGYDADLVIFDQDKVAEGSSFADPRRKSIGIEQVIVNGRVKLTKDRILEGKTGLVLKNHR